MSEDLRFIKLTESVAVSPQVQPTDMAAVAAAGFKVVVDNRPDGEAADQPSAQVMREAAEAAGMEFRYYPLDAFNYPGDDLATMAAVFDDASKPVFAYCRSGTRSANLWISSRSESERAAARESAQLIGFDVSMSLR